MKRLLQFFSSFWDSETAPVDSARCIPTPPPQPTGWRRSDGTSMPNELTPRALRARARGMVVSAGTVASRSGMSRDRLIAILLERATPTENELRWIANALDGIQSDRAALLKLAEQNGLASRLVF